MPSRLIAAKPLFADVGDVGRRALVAIARSRYVTRGSLLAVFGPLGLTSGTIDAWVAAGVLHEGRVVVDPVTPEEQAYLALTRRGGKLLGTTSGITVEGLSPARLRRSQTRSHDVCVGELALAVQALAEGGQVALHGVETDDAKLVVHAIVEGPKGPARVALRPDALVVTEGPHGRTVLLVETDRGTISAATMRRRYASFLAWHRQGGPCRDFGTKALRVVTVVPTEVRLRTLHDEALRANAGRPSGFLVFALQDDVAPCVAERFLEPVARALGNPERRVALLTPKADLQAAAA